MKTYSRKLMTALLAALMLASSLIRRAATAPLPKQPHPRTKSPQPRTLPAIPLRKKKPFPKKPNPSMHSDCPNSIIRARL